MILNMKTRIGFSVIGDLLTSASGAAEPYPLREEQGHHSRKHGLGIFLSDIRCTTPFYGHGNVIVFRIVLYGCNVVLDLHGFSEHVLLNFLQGSHPTCGSRREPSLTLLLTSFICGNPCVHESPVEEIQRAHVPADRGIRGEYRTS
jgi:hypothetical protein